MSHPSGIVTFFHCRQCIAEDKAERLSVGLIDPTTIRVVCEEHELVLGDFDLRKKMDMRCEECDCPDCVPEKTRVH
jgi:hypothetical protein